MRLGRLRALIKDYDETFYTRKYMGGGDHQRATTLKTFVKRFTLHDDEYHLNLNEEFDLAQILSPMTDDYLPLVTLFKCEFKDSTDFFNLFSFLRSKLIQDELLKNLLTIKAVYFTKLLNLARNLANNNLLDNDSTQKLFTLLSQKIQEPVEDSIMVESGNKENLSSTTYTSMKDNFQLHVEETSKPLIGGRGRVLQGTSDKTTQYLVKTLSGKESEHIDREAIRETKYARFLGRDARFFQHNKKWHVISEWQTGETLHHIAQDKLIAIPIKMRIKSLIPMLQELVKLHSQYRIHGDIKGLNCVFDSSSMQMKLIDFGTTRKVKPKKYAITTTTVFLDEKLRLGSASINSQVNYSFCDDMYALGILLASVFPDIYQIKIDVFKTAILLKKPDLSLSLAEKSIHYLVSSMLFENKNARCTSKIALEYCQLLFAGFDDLNQQDLEEMVEKTINKTQISFDDIVTDHHMYSRVCMK